MRGATRDRTSVRQRFRPAFPDDGPQVLPGGSQYPGEPYQARRRPAQSHPLGLQHLVFSCILMVVLYLAVIFIEKRLPVGLLISEEQHHPGEFIAERAMGHLKALTSLGPRVAGSSTNEVAAVDLLQRLIQEIVAGASDYHKIQWEVQESSGAFGLEFLDGMTNVYRNLQNVVIKVGSRLESNHSLLLNCHFDTVADSPGGSDDGAGCAVMLEIFRVLVQSKKMLRHNVVFLFNGAEENFMPASHGFITQHPWAKAVRAFINLEACGAGGRELLFQAGPQNPWMMQVYSQRVPYPYASTLAQEIFQSGVIPGDTDYRIFRDFGKISGLDFAWSTNGYVYHTKFDNIDQIPLGSLQRTGENILALTQGIVNGHHLADIEMYKTGNLVFFDFLGALVLRWDEFLALLINTFSVVLGLSSIYRNTKYFSQDISKGDYVRCLKSSVLGAVLSYIVSFAVVILIALLLNALGRTMSWYARPIWIFFLYVIPSLIAPMIFLIFHSRRFRKKKIQNPSLIYQLYQDAFMLIFCLVLMLTVLVRLRSGFIPLLWVTSIATGNLIKTACGGQWRGWKFLSFHIAIVGLPYTQSFYLLLGALYLFIPIMGRVGSGNNSELMIATLTGLLFSLLNTFVVPLVLLVRNAERLLSFLMGISLISLGVLLLTPLGFPYSADPTAIAPQRFMIAHTNRIFRDETGKVLEEKSGFWIVDLDINSPHSVDRLVPEMLDAVSMNEDCDKYLYCGQPYLVPVLTFIWKTHWIPTAGPTVSKPAKVDFRKETTKDGYRIYLRLKGPDHMGVMISPVKGVELTRWNLTETPPLKSSRWKDRDTYFVYYSYGLKPEDLYFTMDFKIPVGHLGKFCDLAITSHILHGPEMRDSRFEQLIKKFPLWTAVTGWSATYESFML